SHRTSRSIPVGSDGIALQEQPNARHLPQWPNVDRAQVVPGLFNSPHGAAWGHDGEIYVVEWIKHGRVTHLDSPPRFLPSASA
ncbi:MAG: hypothetical protein NTZ08_12005, partial [Verrucomicrobia bacterium]|nr:hypothetical protein [Verrucomicrobiota bacterium]